MIRFTKYILACGASAMMGLAAIAATASDPPREHVDRWLRHREGGVDLDKRIGNEVMYQLFIDRFANGNEANDCLLDGRFCDRSHQDWFRYWGGDLRGLIQKLPYLKQLGVTRIWMTPFFENQQVIVPRHKYGRDVEVTSYHGYWIRDWFRLNQFFTDRGTQDFAIVDELVRQAQPEIRILLDTVANHTSPSDATPESIAAIERREPLSQEGGVRRTHRGALFRDGQYVTSMDEDEQRAGQAGYQRTFHRYGPITSYEDSFQVENHQLDGLADLDQNNPRVASYLADAHKFWLTRFPGLAGYRMDTIKHVAHPYWLGFDRDLYAAHPRAEVVGEWFGAGYNDGGSQRFFRETDMTMFDFSFRQAVETVFLRGGSVRAFTRLWEGDRTMGDARALVTFVDNHDMPRLRGMGMSRTALRQAVALMFASRGVPCVYYGMEQDLFHEGDPGDPYNRPMMTSWDTEAPLYRDIKALATLRKQHPSLRYGATHVVHESDRILAFERVEGNDRVFFAMSTNPIAGSDDFEMRGLGLPDGDYADVLSGRIYPVRGGKVPVSLRKGDVIVLAVRQ